MKKIQNIIELDTELMQMDTNHGKLFVYYSASWCMPCKIVKPILKLLSERHPEIVFLDVDVEQVETNIRSIPTFMISGYTQTLAGPTKVSKTLTGVRTLEMFEEEIRSLFNANH